MIQHAILRSLLRELRLALAGEARASFVAKRIRFVEYAGKIKARPSQRRSRWRLRAQAAGKYLRVDGSLTCKTQALLPEYFKIVVPHCEICQQPKGPSCGAHRVCMAGPAVV